MPINTRQMVGLPSSPSFRYKQLNPAYQSDPRRILGQSLMTQGSSSAPVRTPLQGLGRLSSALVGAYLQKGAMDRQVAREDEFKTNLSSLLGANATPQQKSALQMFPNIMGQSLVTNMTAPRTSTSVVPMNVGGQSGLGTQKTTTVLGGEPITNTTSFSRDPAPKVKKTADILKGATINEELTGFTLQANKSDGVVTGYTVLDKPEKPGFKHAVDLTTGKPVFVSNEQLESNQANFIPIIKNSQIAINADGTVNMQDSIFTGASDGGDLTKSTKSAMQKEIIDASGKANNILSLIADFKPDYFKYEDQFKALEKLGVTLDPATKKSFQEYTDFMSKMARISAKEINSIYGAVLSGGEEQRANEFIIAKQDAPTFALSKLKASYALAKKGIARKQYIMKNGLLPKGKSFRNEVDSIMPLTQFDQILEQRGQAIESQLKTSNPQITEEALEDQVSKMLSKEFGVSF
jgi:hypothetical protein